MEDNAHFPPSSPYHRPGGHPWVVEHAEVVHRGTTYEHAIEHLRCGICALELRGPFFDQASGSSPIYSLKKPGLGHDAAVDVGFIPACHSTLYARR